jgi:hypothetical protein
VSLTNSLQVTTGENIVLVATADPNVWLGHVEGDIAREVFELTIDPVTQSYTLDLLGPDLIAAQELVAAGEGSSFGSGPGTYYIIGDAAIPDDKNNPNDAYDSSDIVLISGKVFDTSGGATFDTTSNFSVNEANLLGGEVNLNNNAYGVANPLVNENEVLVLDFTEDDFGLAPDPGANDAEEFSGPSVTQVTFQADKSGSELTWVAYNAAGDVIATDTFISVKDAPVVVDGNGELISFVLIHGEAGSNAGIVVTSVGTLSNTGQAEIGFEVVATDADGDVSDPAVISITVDGSGDLLGTDASEVISGSQGNDILTGSAGDDIFYFGADDQGTAGTPDVDIITDFNDSAVDEADVLDISDLLVGEESGDITTYLNVYEDNGAVVLDVTPDGSGGGHTEQIRLEGTTLDELGAGAYDVGTQQTEIIETLISQGHLDVDQ